MADSYLQWGSLLTPTDFSTSLSALASSASAGRQSAAIDLTAGGVKVVNGLIRFRFKLATGGTLANDKAVYLWIFGSHDGTNWPQANGNAVSGSDSALTTKGIEDIVMARIAVNVASYTTGADRFFETNPVPISTYFGSALPKKITFGVRNYSGVAFTNSTTDHVVDFEPVYYTSV